MNRLARGAAVALAVFPVCAAQLDKTFEGEVRPYLKQYCVVCHSAQTKTAGVALDGLARPGFVAAQNGSWERVLRKVRTGEMPPSGMPRPPQARTAALVNWLGGELDRAAAAKPDPGRITVHRLNRAEYNNAVRDLLAVDLRPADDFPADDSGYGFDNIADVLSMPPVLMEKYLASAGKVSRTALGRVRLEPVLERYSVPRNAPQDGRLQGAPIGTRGGVEVVHKFPADAEYLLRVRMRGTPDNAVPDVLDVYLDGRQLRRMDAKFGSEEEDEEQRRLEIRVPVTAGRHRVLVSFLRDDSKNESPRLEYSSTGIARRTPLAVDWVEVGGPFNVKGPGDTESRRRVLICSPGATRTEEECATEILSRLARRAWRRPVTAAETARLLGFYRMGKADTGEFEGGIELGLKAILVSPYFLFRVEQAPAGVKPGTSYPISGVELAARLSFFLWSSIPDEMLLALGENGELRKPEVLEAQVRRMLRDPRAQALTANFAGQWLHLRNLASMKPDPERFPGFDSDLREAMARETELFFETVVKEDRSATDFLDARFTFVNERLARYYGIPNVEGRQFRRVDLTDGYRGGVLTMASVLTVTSYPTRTSPVIRGKWVLDNLLGAPPPPPPPDVPPLVESGLGKTASMRQQIEQHRANPACAACHAKMDPIGFALENYDAVGRWRTREGGLEIDASGTLPSGESFRDAAGLKAALRRNPQEFVLCFTEKLLTYALGRGVEWTDKPVVRAIARDAARQDYRFSSVVLGIVKSAPFGMRRSKEVASGVSD